jgi:ppGpp synthetase/RelA/SpoT-type nucleotidyltranferase
MTPPPKPFTPDTYLAWHDASFPTDAPLRDRLESLRAELAGHSRDLLTALAQIMTYAANYCRREYQLAAKTATDYDISLSKALRGKPTSASYDLLFKSTSSIINKLWRKNTKVPPAVHLGNLKDHITDLVRTDIAATTLDSARFLAERMNALPGIIHEAKVRKAFDDCIASIRFEPEMKMESGYFAYHGEVRFKNGLIVEVQIYSDLMKQWRRLSHIYYELARVEEKKQHEFNSKESRLISLGHLLHMAECELYKLAQEFGGH